MGYRFPRLDCRVDQYIGKGQVKDIFWDVYAFALREYNNGETPTFKTIENEILGHISPETIIWPWRVNTDLSSIP